MAELPVYLPSRRCPKCGGESDDRYHAGGKQYPASWEREFRPCRGEPIGEHLDRTCRRCQYGWVEACVDQGADRG